MPIYEYICNTCGKEFEVMQKFSDPPLTKHTCSPKARVERKLSVPAFHLQGGGWYAEGYSSKKDGNGKGESKSGAATASAVAKSEPSGAKSDKAEKKPEKATKKDSAPASA